MIKKRYTHGCCLFYLHFARKISTHKNEPQYRPCSQIISMSFLYGQKWATEWIGILSYFTGGPFGPDRIRKHNFLHFFSFSNVPTAARTMETSEMVKKNHLFGQFLHKFQQVWSLNQIGSMLIKSFLVLTHRLTWSDIYSVFKILHWPFIQQIEPIFRRQQTYDQQICWW